MKSTTIISASILGMFMMIPSLALAEEVSTGASAITPPPAPPVTVDGYSFGESHPQTPPGTGMTGMEAPPKPVLIRESPTRRTQEMMIRESPTKQNSGALRDSASGQATGKRMMASGTPMSDERREKMEARKEEMREKMEERRSEMLERMSTQMITKMKAAVERFTKLGDRVDSRIAKMKEKGIDTTTAVANMVVARAKIAAASTAIASAESSIAAAVAAIEETPTGDGIKNVRSSLQVARTAIGEAHKALVASISSLRANVKSEAGSPTTTVAQ